MALPVITNNSPTAGSISWTATAMAYDGVGYSIAAGSSSRKFVWWQYNSGAPAMMDSDTLPTLAPEDVLMFLNKGGIGALVPTADTVDGSLIVSGSIYSAAIASDQIQTYHLAAQSVTSSQLDAGAVTADSIAAGAVTTDKLSVGSVGDSLVSNGSFEEFVAGLPLGWAVQNATNGGSSDIVSGVASSGAYALRLSATGTTSDVRVRQDITKQIPVTAVAGRKWYVSANVGAGTAVTKGFYLRINWFTATGANSATPTTDIASNAAVGSTWAPFEGQALPPSDAAYMRIEVLLVSPNVATNIYIDEVTAREVVVSAIIADGAITTPKLVANAVTAGIIAANAVTAGTIAAGAVTATTIAAGAISASSLAAGSVTTNAMAAGSINADRLLAGSITAAAIAVGAVTAQSISASALNGMTITGPTIQTSVAGARVILDGTGINAFDSSNNPYFSVANGTLVASGSFSFTGYNGWSGTTTLAYGGTKPVPGMGEYAGLQFTDTQATSMVTGPSITTTVDPPSGRQQIRISSGQSNIEQSSNIMLEPSSGIVMTAGMGLVNVTISASGTDVTGGLTANGDNVLVATPGLLPGSYDLNIVTHSGTFYQNSNTNAASGTNYPVALAGLLEVSTYNNFTHQRYTAYGNSNRAFWRALYNSTWSPWNEYRSVGEGQSIVSALSPSGFSIGGSIFIEQFAGSNRVSLDLNVQSTGSTLSITTGAYATIGTILPSVALSASAFAAYKLVQVVGDALNNQAICFINPSSGICSMRAVGSNFSLGSGALFSLEYAYPQ